MQKIIILMILLSLSVYGCATTGNKETVQNTGNKETVQNTENKETVQNTENKETVQNNCVPNFTEEGGFWEGKTFRSFKDFSNLSKGQAFDKALTAVTANGLQIATSNKDTGLISASTGIAFGQGSRAPFNVLIKDIGKKRVRVEISYNIGPGSIAPTSAIIENFCKFYNAISPNALENNKNSFASDLKVKKKSKK